MPSWGCINDTLLELYYYSSKKGSFIHPWDGTLESVFYGVNLYKPFYSFLFGRYECKCKCSFSLTEYAARLFKAHRLRGHLRRINKLLINPLTHHSLIISWVLSPLPLFNVCRYSYLFLYAEAKWDMLFCVELSTDFWDSFRRSFKNTLIHLVALISFDTPWKHQKTSGFLIFSGCMKRDQWHEMGWQAYLEAAIQRCSYKKVF